jgi:uncharacterized iron-regulated protein
VGLTTGTRSTVNAPKGGKPEKAFPPRAFQAIVAGKRGAPVVYFNLSASRVLLVILFLLLGAGCAPKSSVMPEPASGQASGQAFPATGLLRLEAEEPRPLSDADFLALIREVDYLLLGEGHAVACDHLAQAAVLRLLEQESRTWALGLEMLSQDRQPVLDQINANPGPASADVTLLEQQLEWAKVWGYPFSLYAPVLEAALEQGMTLHALNVSRPVLDILRGEGLQGLSAEERSRLPREFIPPMQEQEKALEMVFSLHQDFMGGGMSVDPDSMKRRLERFFLVQSIWDTAMAVAAITVRQGTGRPVAILAGAGHVENGWGIAHRLRTLEPAARVLLVLPWRGGDPPKPQEADVFYFCPESFSSRLGMKLVWQEEPAGALVEAVEQESVAGRADLRPGDVIQTAADAPLESLSELHIAAIKARQTSDPLRLRVLRQGYVLNVTVPLPSRQDRTTK